MKYYCNNCCEILDESELEWRNTELEDSRSPWDKVAICPCCGSEELEEAAFCERCGEPIPPGEHLCDVCEGDLYGIVQGAIESFQGDVLDAKDKFFDYLEREWY